MVSKACREEKNIWTLGQRYLFKNLLVHTFAKELFNYFFKKCRGCQRRCSIKKLFSKFRNIHRKTPMLGFLFNSKYCKIFKSSYFEKHLRTAVSENVFMKQKN